MPKSGFICPNGTKVTTEQCLEHCIMDKRCCPKRYLEYASNKEHEEQVGEKYSVTELIRGTRESYLRRVKDFYEKPNDSAFAVLGTKAHTSVETGTRMEWEGITGQYDDLDDEDGGTLVEYKTYGSYKMISILGLEEVPTGEIGKRGAVKKEWKKTGIPDLEELSLQLGMYQLMLAQKNVPVYHLKAHIIVRDGGLYIAKQRGIYENTYYVDVPMMEPDEIQDYFLYKKENLDAALANRSIPVRCSDKECWNGNKCEKFCPVAEWCEGNPYIREI